MAQHEISHLFYAVDHYATCCIMASHTHYQTLIWEDKYWSVFAEVPCSLTSYFWCSACHDIIDTYKELYVYDPQSNILVVRIGPTVYPYWMKRIADGKEKGNFP